MRKSDKIQFDTAKERVQKSKLDDHSKEGISVALEMSGEACNGMEADKKMEALTQAVFALTLSVSYFMSQAPEHLDKSVNAAIEGHVGKCNKLMNAQKAPRGEGGSAISFSFKEGIRAKGPSAIIIAAVIAVMLSLYGIVSWQNSKTQAAFKAILDKKIEQLTVKPEVSKNDR